MRDNALNSEELQGYCSGPEKDALFFLAGAVEDAQAAYKDSPSGEHLLAYENAQAAYEKKYASLVKKYKKKANEKTVESWDDFENTKKISVVLRSLQGLGYDVKQKTLYNHAKTGVLQKNLDGFYTKKLTRKYVRERGLRSSRDEIFLTEDSGTTDKALHDAKKAKYQALNEQQRYLKNKAKLGSRHEFNLQMAGRLALLDSRLRGFIDQHGAEFIALVGGDQDKKADLYDFWVKKFSAVMREMSKPLDYKIIFKSNERD